MDYISRDVARAIIENQQKALCPVGLWGRKYVYDIDLEKYDELEAALDSIDGIPTADVTEVRHARWIPEENGDVYFSCSYCGCEICTSWDYDDLEWNFCPECGRAMDGGADNGERNL